MGELNKVVEDGQVAVLYSPGWGAGWYTWNENQALMFDPILVELVKLKNQTQEGGFEHTDIMSRIIKRAEELEPNGYFGGADDLMIYWMEEGTQFFIDEYDGSESISTRENTQWLTA